MIDQMKLDYPIAELCRVLECPRSSYDARPQSSELEASLVEAAERVLMRWPFYGYRRLLAQLKREGWQVGERVVRRLLRWLGGSRQVGRVRVQTTDSRHAHPRYPNRIKGLKITRPDQLWVGDITYIRLGKRFIELPPTFRTKPALGLRVFSHQLLGHRLTELRFRFAHQSLDLAQRHLLPELAIRQHLVYGPLRFRQQLRF
jgi:transposase InsO family protein